MDNQFVPKEFEKILISLGFDYTQRVHLIFKEKKYYGILWQQAFDWFMNNYKLFPKIDQYYGERFYVNIEDMNFPRLYSSDKLRDLGEYSSYEEARLECLKNLIEIVKNDK